MAFIPPSELRRVEGTMPSGGMSLQGTMTGMDVAPPPPQGAPPILSLTDLAGLQQAAPAGAPPMQLAPQAPQSPIGMDGLPGMDLGAMPGMLPGIPAAPAPTPEEQGPSGIEQLMQLLLVGGAAALAKDPKLFAEGLLTIRKNVTDTRARNATRAVEQRGQDIVARGQDASVRGQNVDLMTGLAGAQARTAEAGARTERADNTEEDRLKKLEHEIEIQRERLRVQEAELAAARERTSRVASDEEAKAAKAKAKEAEAAAKKERGKTPDVAPQQAAVASLRKRVAGLPEAKRKSADKTITAIESNLNRYRAQLQKQRKAGETEPMITLNNGQQVAGADAILATLNDAIPDALTEAGLGEDAAPDAQASLSVIRSMLEAWDADAEPPTE